METFLQAVLGGLTAGSIYALVAIGVSLILKVSRVLNLAQGEFLAVGALLAFSVVTVAHQPLWLACLAAILVVTVVGLVFERLAIRPARSQTMTVLLVITLGTSILLRGLALVIWGSEPMSLPAFSGTDPLLFWNLAILPQALWVLSGIVLVAVGLWYFFERTLLGKAMLAAAENRAAAEMIGINVIATSRLAFGLSAAVAALAGVLVGPITFLSYDGGTMIGLKGFVAATIGRMGNITGAIAGGLFLGVLEALIAGYFSSLFKDVTAFIVLIVVLVFRAGLDKRTTLTQA
ncbi:MAG: branched-chain amino acid ABC transporter permease [bacterium]